MFSKSPHYKSALLSGLSVFFFFLSPYESSQISKVRRESLGSEDCFETAISLICVCMCVCLSSYTNRLACRKTKNQKVKANNTP